MHPLISLVCFLIFAAFVSLGNIVVSLLGLLLLAGTWWYSKTLPTPRAWRMLRRMKLFFISIVLLYSWFTPGQLILPGLENWSPSLEGLLLGAERIVALIILVIAVDSFLNLMSRQQILTALYYFFYPLHFIGFNRERFMLRTLLTLEAATNNTSFSLPEITNAPKDVSAYLDRMSLLVRDLIAAPVNKTEEQIIVVELDSPPVWYFWLIPLVLLMLFVGVRAW